MEAQIRQAWEDTGRGSGLAVWKFLREEGQALPKSLVEATVRGFSVQQVFGPPPKFKGHIVAGGVGERWMVDLADLTAQPSDDGHGAVEPYILVAVDVFSRYVWARAMFTKRPEVVSDAFESIMRDARTTPKSITTDKGAEFTGDFQALLDRFEIAHELKEGPQDIAVVDNAISRLKVALFKALAEAGGRNWAKLLAATVGGINRRPQSGYLGDNAAAKAWHAPQHEAKNKVLEYQLVKQAGELATASDVQVGKRADKLEEQGKFRVLDRPLDFNFSRGYKPRWSDKVYDVASVKAGYVVDFDGKQHLTKMVLPVPEASADTNLDPRLRRGSESVEKRRRELLEPFRGGIAEYLVHGPKSFRYVWLHMKHRLGMEDALAEAKMNFLDALRLLGFEVRETGGGAIIANSA